MGRTAARAGIELAGRLQLVEEDLDGLEQALDRVGDKLSRILVAVVGLLISVCTTCIVLLITTAVGR